MLYETVKSFVLFKIDVVGAMLRVFIRRID
jgi:hypothetical protein